MNGYDRVLGPGGNWLRRGIGQAVFFFTICAIAHLSSCGYECYGTQENFSVTPPESCIQPVFDVCDAEIGALTLQNKCADPLVILDPTGGAGISDGGVVDTTQIEVSIAPGAQTDFSCLAFTNSSDSKTWHVTIPAVLGSTSIAISFDIAR